MPYKRVTWRPCHTQGWEWRRWAEKIKEIMIIPTTSRNVLNYLYRQRGEKGNIYGNIAYHTGLTTWEEAKNYCQILFDNRLAEWKEERVFITATGSKWLEDFKEKQDERIREYVYEDYEFALLRFLYELDQPLSVDEFPEILKDEAPEYTDGSATYNLIHMLQIKWRSYVESPGNKYQLKVAGRKYFEHLAKQKGVLLRGSTVSGTIISDFTEMDKKELNDRIDQALWGLEQVVRDDLAELKELYILDKKNWRQLLTGKLSEMVKGGLITDAISKSISNTINPVLTIE